MQRRTIIKRDGTVLVEKLTYHGLPGLLSSETKNGSLHGDILEDVKAILIQNEDILKGRFSSASWMGWPLAITYNGNVHILDREEYERSENNLKPIIRKLIPLLQEVGIDVHPRDFFC